MVKYLIVQLECVMILHQNMKKLHKLENKN